MTERVILEPGMPAPSFTLPDQDGVERSLADYRGQKVVLFFYPEAMTPACTKEACEFQESSAPLEAAGYRVLGVSRDAVERLRRFADRDSLEYPLLSDPDTAVHRAYGAFGTKNSYGRIIEGVIRSTFVIDADGKIEHALYNIKATGHVARVTKLLGV
ncbi:peroxiredoxin [Leucobacter sp. OLIS6]|uniref:thioredoxin-dependent thiol peroxidase n=2 Tax=Leucobacter TaxID=55968 RepID=UPI000C1A72F1|nr:MULTISPECIES: thioredoxin-dependent thiol peroxidase [unclassified Leucobacter]PIJ49084.1 peroxiredoxin [Leucobacter sp. OLES1]PII83293.1 peroxiredoxin [Leucobacter sp. OLCALW19]PII86844.1 peroxiredoxin [Leucobacter sp. OLTLW20]PII91220.1 peroxiredoxin [Leucobacter sp. OLAS13]PII98679.1 peroxiredoxin [Leucobacter sp. OLDS2]